MFSSSSTNPSPARPTGAGIDGSGGKGPEIVVIPEKFYGVALHMEGKTEAESATPAPAPVPIAPKPIPVVTAAPTSSWRQHLPAILIVVGLFMLVGGGFVYLNRGLLFGKKPDPQTVPVVTVTVPSQPSSLVVTSTAPQSASLSWLDTATNEDGYRIERKAANGDFIAITNLSPNSEAFLDVTAQSGETYSYRVVALNSAGESDASNEAVATVQSAPTLIAVATSTAQNLPPGGLDSDSDGLTDAEEPLFNTDIRNPDTDKDGFIDGNEVFHLYNPSAVAPVRLSDSGLVKAVTSTVGWRLEVPTAWQVAYDKPDGSAVALTFGRPEGFRVTLEENPEGLSVQDWYVAQNPSQTGTALSAFGTKSNVQGYTGPDRMDAYFSSGGKILVIRYDLAGQPYINYRATFEMMLQSISFETL